MQHRLHSAIRVSFARVVIIAVALVVLPGFTLMARNDASDPAATVAAPVGVETAQAQAFESEGVHAAVAAASESAAFALTEWEGADLGNIDPKVFALALSAARCAIRNGVVVEPRTLTVIDYSRPSTQKRLWVFDVREQALLYEELVAHGRGSGENYATAFSNVPDSYRTSLGLFVTDDTYIGRNGYSLRMNGLDKGFNDRARERAIVMHGASYVSPSFAKAQGRIGRSHGCPALNEAIAREVIDTVKGGGLVFSYYPDEGWLKRSQYLNDCAAAD